MSNVSIYADFKMVVLVKLLSHEDHNLHWFYFNIDFQFWFPTLDTARYLRTVTIYDYMTLISDDS